MRYTDKDQRVITEFTRLMTRGAEGPELMDGEYLIASCAMLTPPGHINGIEGRWMVSEVHVQAQPEPMAITEEQDYGDLSDALWRVGLVIMRRNLAAAQENVRMGADYALQYLHEKCERIEKQVQSYEGCEDADAADLALTVIQRGEFDLDEKDSVIANHVACSLRAQ